MATQTSSQDLNNLTINRVTSPEAFEQMISAGVISANEFYLVEGENETVDWSNVTNKPSTFPPESHSHGNITNAGTVSTTAAIGNGDKLAIIDSSDSSKVTGSTISFDGSTATKALTQKGTWETFNNYSLTVATASALGGIKIGFQESANNYAVKLSSEKAYVTVPYATETSAGIVSASTQTFGGDKTFKSNKFYVYADEIRFRNKDASNNQSASNAWVTSLHIGDGEYVTLNEYKDDHLAIRGSSILLNTTTFSVYNASSTYSVGSIVWYNKAYYICKTAIETAEEWNAEHWTVMPSAGVMSNAHLTPWKTNTYTLGSSAYRWSKLYVGTADTYGSTSQPIYWNAGVPTAITGALANDITGNAATATTLKTSRTFTIGSASKTFNGSANVSWTVSTANVIKTVTFTAGSTPTLGTAFSIPNVTGNTSVTASKVTKSDNPVVKTISQASSTSSVIGTVANGVLTLTEAITAVGAVTAGSTVTASAVTITDVTATNTSLGTAFSVPNVTGVGTAPTLTTTTQSVITGIS